MGEEDREREGKVKVKRKENIRVRKQGSEREREIRWVKEGRSKRIALNRAYTYHRPLGHVRALLVKAFFEFWQF